MGSLEDVFLEKFMSELNANDFFWLLGFAPGFFFSSSSSSDDDEDP